jgi:hypothetical protein
MSFNMMVLSLSVMIGAKRLYLVLGVMMLWIMSVSPRSPVDMIAPEYAFLAPHATHAAWMRRCDVQAVRRAALRLNADMRRRLDATAGVGRYAPRYKFFAIALTVLRVRAALTAWLRAALCVLH